MTNFVGESKDYFFKHIIFASQGNFDIEQIFVEIYVGCPSVIAQEERYHACFNMHKAHNLTICTTLSLCLYKRRHAER